MSEVLDFSPLNVGTYRLCFRPGACALRELRVWIDTKLTVTRTELSLCQEQCLLRCGEDFSGCGEKLSHCSTCTMVQPLAPNGQPSRTELAEDLRRRSAMNDVIHDRLRCGRHHDNPAGCEAERLLGNCGEYVPYSHWGFCPAANTVDCACSAEYFYNTVKAPSKQTHIGFSRYVSCYDACSDGTVVESGGGGVSPGTDESQWVQEGTKHDAILGQGLFFGFSATLLCCGTLYTAWLCARGPLYPPEHPNHRERRWFWNNVQGTGSLWGFYHTYQVCGFGWVAMCVCVCSTHYVGV